MQPHRYTRLHNFLNEFAKVLELSDRVFITPIYTAREEYNGVDHNTLLQKIKENGKIEASFVKNAEDLAEKIKFLIQPGDFIIFLGAGDITQWAYSLPELLTQELER